ncbi:MFS transporter [Arhodomonas sp. AD133]|uniref:MFS transporter n=1 Tax=Arhodomonas sp. AD133 TaxID=3415009 RepID=UPI003EBD12F1
MAASAPAHSLAEHTRPASRRPALTAVCAAVVLAQLDTSVVNVAARPIGDYFRASVDALQWVVAIYNLVYAALLLTGGLLADLYGRRRMFLVGAAAFSRRHRRCVQ